jgi:CRP/FNR family cyclic AMP-dependent transcriptional regulator
MRWRAVPTVVTVTAMESARAQRLRNVKALANVSWLRDDQLRKLADALRTSRYEKRSTIFSDKSPVESAHILLSGVARITCDNRKGRRITVIMLAPGLVPAFPTAISSITYNFRCEAVTNCLVGTVGLNNFMKICLGINAKSFKQMAASFLGRWDRVHLRCSNLIGCTLDERLALVLLDLIENFGVPNDDGGVRLTVPVRHDDLAELVGATRPRVTEHLHSFTQRHLISRQDRYLVVDPEGLKGVLLETRREGFSEEPS